MQQPNRIRVTNWKGSIVSYPCVVTYPKTVDDIVAILKDPDTYPAPVRAVGSNHSTTRCGVADQGTLIVMTEMNRIINIGPDSVTTEAGALYIDVAKELQKHDLQFYVNVELGNLTIGSGACGGTKDASMPGEFGQVASYAVGFKLVTPSGQLLEVTEDDPELLQIMRSSYGLLGIIYEVTFKVKPMKPMSVEHTTFDLDEFDRQFSALTARDEAMMLYLFPFQNRITAEFRKYSNAGGAPNRFLWKLRNFVWKTVGPTYGFVVTKLIPFKTIRYALIDAFDLVVQKTLSWVLRDRNTIPADQLIRYPDKAGWSSYTFSIWAFPEEGYLPILRRYFAFCQAYYQQFGYRCNLVNVGYRIAQDTSSLFSYSYHGNVLTLDPVSTGDPGWNDFLVAYNDFCSENGGIPLFNQTRAITPEQAKKAFGDRLPIFQEYRQRFDPGDRLLNDYFREMLS